MDNNDKDIIKKFETLEKFVNDVSTEHDDININIIKDLKNDNKLYSIELNINIDFLCSRTLYRIVKYCRDRDFLGCYIRNNTIIVYQ